jgi:hypothetical protein
VSFAFGLSYVGPWANLLNPDFVALKAIMPMNIWGLIWVINGAFLVPAAFRPDQAKALGLTTGMFTVWCLNYVSEAFISSVNDGGVRYWLTAILFGGMVVCLQGLARMVNPAPVHLEVVEKAGPPAEGDPNE